MIKNTVIISLQISLLTLGVITAVASLGSLASIPFMLYLGTDLGIALLRGVLGWVVFSLVTGAAVSSAIWLRDV